MIAGQFLCWFRSHAFASIPKPVGPCKSNALHTFRVYPALALSNWITSVNRQRTLLWTATPWLAKMIHILAFSLSYKLRTTMAKPNHKSGSEGSHNQTQHPHCERGLMFSYRNPICKREPKSILNPHSYTGRRDVLQDLSLWLLFGKVKSQASKATFPCRKKCFSIDQ